MKNVTETIKEYNVMIAEQKSWGHNKVAKLLEDMMTEELK